MEMAWIWLERITIIAGIFTILGCFINKIYGDRAIHYFETVQTRIGLSLIEINASNPRVRLQAFVEGFLDKLFGKNIFSKRSFLISLAHTFTFSLFFIVISNAIFLATSESKEPLPTNYVWFSIYFVISTTGTNFLWDFFSYSATRKLVRYARDKRIIYIILVLVLDVILSIMFGIIAAYQKYLGVYFGAYINNGEPIKEVLDKQIIACIFTSLAATIWMWLYFVFYAVSTPINLGLQSIGVIGGRRNIVDNPIIFLGFVLFLISLLIIFSLSVYIEGQ